MGTADKVCAAALAIHEQMRQQRVTPERGVVRAAGARRRVHRGAWPSTHGRIVDGIGGTSGPLGLRAAGALDGEVAFLAGPISKAMLFDGGAASVAGDSGHGGGSTDDAADGGGTRGVGRVPRKRGQGGRQPVDLGAWPRAIVLSGRLARVAVVREALERRLTAALGDRVGPRPDRIRAGRQAGRARGSAPGRRPRRRRSKPLVDALGIRDAPGTVLDHLYVIAASEARRRLGIRVTATCSHLRHIDARCG